MNVSQHHIRNVGVLNGFMCHQSSRHDTSDDDVDDSRRHDKRMDVRDISHSFVGNYCNLDWTFQAHVRLTYTNQKSYDLHIVYHRRSIDRIEVETLTYQLMAVRHVVVPY